MASFPPLACYGSDRDALKGRCVCADASASASMCVCVSECVCARAFSCTCVYESVCVRACESQDDTAAPRRSGQSTQSSCYLIYKAIISSVDVVKSSALFLSSFFFAAAERSSKYQLMTIHG